jgi:transposase
VLTCCANSKEHAMNASTTAASRRPTAGIDWASEDHAVAIVDPDGVAIHRFTTEHTGVGLRALVKTLQRVGVEAVGIERPDGRVVDALLEHAVTVFVIAPSQVKNLRSRYGSAGNKDDRFDAYVLADAVRTDRHRLTALTQDSPQTVTLRMTVRARKDLIGARVAMANQLRAHLQHALPGAIGLFRDIDSAITLAFLTRFPSQTKADWLRPIRLEKWLRSAGYNNPTNAPALHAHLTAAPRGTTGPEDGPRAAITLALVAALTALRTQIKALEEQIAAQLAAHPDGHIFTSLPRAGTVRAARLLAEIGDARGRYPTPESLVCLAAPPPRRDSRARSKSPLSAGPATSSSAERSPTSPGLPHRQRLGRGPLPPGPRPRPRPPARRPDPGPRVAPRDLRCWQDGVAYNPNNHRALQRGLAPAA